MSSAIDAARWLMLFGAGEVTNFKLFTTLKDNAIPLTWLRDMLNAGYINYDSASWLLRDRFYLTAAGLRAIEEGHACN